nr:MAG TPA: hypothetical protein [Caudoviricetes sp.]
MAKYLKRETVIDLITRRYENPEICTQEINSIPTADVAPIEALEHLRDELCAQDLITMEGLRKLNTLIWKYTTAHDGGADHEAD